MSSYSDFFGVSGGGGKGGIPINGFTTIFANSSNTPNFNTTYGLYYHEDDGTYWIKTGKTIGQATSPGFNDATVTANNGYVGAVTGTTYDISPYMTDGGGISGFTSQASAPSTYYGILDGTNGQISKYDSTFTHQSTFNLTGNPRGGSYIRLHLQGNSWLSTIGVYYGLGYLQKFDASGNYQAERATAQQNIYNEGESSVGGWNNSQGIYFISTQNYTLRKFDYPPATTQSQIHGTNHFGFQAFWASPNFYFKTDGNAWDVTGTARSEYIGPTPIVSGYDRTKYVYYMSPGSNTIVEQKEVRGIAVGYDTTATHTELTNEEYFIRLF